MTRSTVWTIGLALAGIVGCSSTEATTSTTTTSSSSSGSTSSGVGGAGGQGAGGGASGGHDPGSKTLSASIGPVTVASGEERTQCIVMNLKNPEAVFARKFTTTLHEGSHHMIVYKSNAKQEDLTPKDCAPLSGLLSGSHPVFIAQQAHSVLDFPTDNGTPVALKLEANQMLKIEMHYINTTQGPLDVIGTSDIDVLPLTANVIESDLAFWGTGKIDIPANGEYDTGVKFQPALAGAKVFALTTHQHHLGTSMKVWKSKDAMDTSNMVTEGTNWNDEPLALFSPALEFPTNGNAKLSTEGFSYDCHWKNTTASHVGFGESFYDEMCFLWMYYYPSQGFQVCTDGFCKTTP